jgi:hypothetical protein
VSVSEPTSTGPGPVVRSLPAPTSYMCGLTWDGSRLWHSDQDQNLIVAVDPENGRVVRRLACAQVRADLTHDGRHLLQIGGRPKRLVVIDADDGHVVGHRELLPASGRTTGAEFGSEGLWTVLRSPTTLQLRARDDLAILREFPVDGESPSGLTVAGDVVVHGDFDDGVLRATDSRTGAPLGRLDVPGRPTGVTWDGSLVWYCDFPGRAFRAVPLAAVTGG